MSDDVCFVFVEKIIGALAQRGVNVDAVLGKAGVERSRVANERLPVRQYSSLWCAAALELDDEFLGQDSRRMTAGTFAMICGVAIQSDNLGHALEKIIRLFSVTLADIEISLHVNERSAELTLADRRMHDGIFAHEMLLGLIYDLCSWLINERLPLSQLEFAYPEPSYSQEYSRYYGAPGVYDKGITSVRFSTRLLRRSVSRDRHALREYLGAEDDDVIVQYRDTTLLHRFVRATLRSSPPDDMPSLSLIAARLGVGKSTLNRHLRNEGHSFSSLQRQVRLERAMQYLRLEDTSMESIAFDLGFSGTSEFRRAFKDWTSNSATDFRHRSGDCHAVQYASENISLKKS